MTIAEIMQSKLEAALSPTTLEIVDESHLHAGHMGARPEGETHFRMTIVSPAFSGLNRVQRHRVVHEVVAEELRERVHALALVLRAPEDL